MTDILNPTSRTTKTKKILPLDSLYSYGTLVVLPPTSLPRERNYGVFIMEPNPVKVYRDYLGLSINELELQAQVHRQVIIRTEQGCYNVIPPRLYSFLVSRMGEGNPSLAYNYKHWITEKRRSSYGALPIALPPFDPSRHPFILWRESGLSEWNKPLNRTEVCKLFCVHPSTLTRFETNLMMQSVPTQLYDALLDSGYSTELLDELSVLYKRYRIYQLNSNTAA